MIRLIISIIIITMQILRYHARLSLNRTFGCKRSITTKHPEKSPFLMVASIGNPEPEYQNTRHNVGNWVLDQLANSFWQDFKPFERHRNLQYGLYSTKKADSYSTGSLSPLSNLFLFKSVNSYMNLQGDPISKTWQKLKSIQDQRYSTALVIIHDELQIPVGKVQIRKQLTSPRGHNGLKSINSFIGKGYTKISIGVGRPTSKHDDISNYVLSKFSPKDKDILMHEVVPQVAQILKDMSQGQYIYDVADEEGTKKKSDKKK